MRNVPGSAAAAGRPAANSLTRLFPELVEFADPRRVVLAEGLLRAPPRGAGARPCLSALPVASGTASIRTAAQILAERGWEEPALLARASAARRALIEARVGAEWWHGADDRLPAGKVAIVDLAGAGDAAAMLDAAIDENPAEQVVVLPALRASAAAAVRQKIKTAAECRAIVIQRRVEPWHLLDHAVRVYTMGGELGLLALLCGVPVSAFGDACYTGWGLTQDAHGIVQHAMRRTRDEVFAALCLLATRYRDPFHDTPGTFEDTLALLADWRRLDEANRRIAVCVGMSFWKRRRIADFLRSSTGVPVFRRTTSGALAAIRRNGVATGAIAGWASRLPPGLATAATTTGVPLIRVEDGFIRSVGLGADFLPPASVVFDRNGIYYDPSTPSDLEILLRETAFAPALLTRAQHLTATLVARGVTKYNLAGGGLRLELPRGRRRILVPGQVEDDLSLELGGRAVRTNLALLAEVRAANPGALLLYKPHPDVIAGHRKGAVSETEVRRFADLVVADAPTATLLAEVDELHTMTSLVGFEALLRGRRVVVYGRPFYAGWGLTTDCPPFDRGRRLTLDELVAGALILYPRYLDPLTRLLCGPEIIIERLDNPDLWRPGLLVQARQLQGAALRRVAEWRTLLSAPSGGLQRGMRERTRP